MVLASPGPLRTPPRSSLPPEDPYPVLLCPNSTPQFMQLSTSLTVDLHPSLTPSLSLSLWPFNLVREQPLVTRLSTSLTVDLHHTRLLSSRHLFLKSGAGVDTVPNPGLHVAVAPFGRFKLPSDRPSPILAVVTTRRGLHGCCGGLGNWGPRHIPRSTEECCSFCF